MSGIRLPGLIAVFAGVIVLALFDPATTWWYPACPFRALTGWSCPGCGSLRALHALLHLDVGVAFRANAVTTAAALLWPAAAACRAAGVGPGPVGRALRPRIAVLALLLLSLFAVVRNIPAWPFVLLVR